MTSRLRVGEVLGEAWLLYTRNSPRLIATAAIVFAVLALVDGAVEAGTRTRGALVPISLLVTIVGVFWLQGALVLLVDDLRSGRPAVSIRELFRRVEPRLVTLVLAGLLAAAGIVVGLAILVVPGLILLTLWSFVIPAVVLERRGVREAFGRSAALVRGNGLQVFLIIVLTVGGATIVSWALFAVLLGVPGFVGFYVASVVANSVTVPYVALTWTVMYFELRSPS